MSNGNRLRCEFRSWIRMDFFLEGRALTDPLKRHS